MQIPYPAELRGFAEDVREFVRRELPANVREGTIAGRRISREDRLIWQRRLDARGWAVPSWPKEYGGTGWSPMQQHVFSDVLAEEGAPDFIPFGQSMIAPVLMAVGSPEQRAYYLPRIRTLEAWFCQGFSEPGSGSDLASLKTRAVQDGDHWVINGQKTWTTMAHIADVMFCLVRTRPDAPKPQEGISMLVFPMNTPGITVRPIITIDGEHDVNEVFFDDVRVPYDSLIGQPHKGWDYAKLLLGHERHSIARVGQSKRELKRLKKIAGIERADGTRLIDQPAFREKIALLEIELLALEVSNVRMLSNTRRNTPGSEANMLKIRGSEIQQTLTELMMEAVGPWGLPFDGDALHGDGAANPIGPDYAGTLAANYLRTRVVTIYGGSNEIQRNILSKSLGL